MIGRLTGTVASEAPDGTVVIDVHGVGYEVLAPLGTLGRAARDADGRVTLQIHTHVREDAIVLFGFSDERERMAFRVLTSVAGVGPKIAVGILGSLPSTELVGAVARNDVKRLQAVPGVGKKIAERLALELKDKLAADVLSQPSSGATGAGAVPGMYTAAPPSARSSLPMRPLVDALVRLGFRAGEAERAAAELAGREGEPIEALMRDALRLLTP
ncbi:MAG: Holliday junction branch migration protein RuvA [Deltaproteobacteria bacterium]